jgi:cysteinyl-tRNA synthetase
MSNHYLGASFDIHGGGRDLLFPHHENERAQSLCANGGSFARYWVHNGFVTVESEKMSKSLGNFLTIRDALKTYHPEVLRLFLLSKHYRGPLDFSRGGVLDLQSGLIRIYRALQRLEALIGPYEDQQEEAQPAFLPHQPDTLLEQFVNMMDDDLNTSGVIGLVFEKVREMNKFMDSINGALGGPAVSRLADERRQLLLAGQVLGLLKETPKDFFSQLTPDAVRVDPSEIEKMIEQRGAAKERKDWKGADEIRDRLKETGVILEDGPEGTTWRFDV